MHKGSIFTFIVLVLSFVLTWKLVHTTPLFTKELYGFVVVIVVSIVGLISVHHSSKSWFLFVVVYGAFLLNTAYLYWRFGGDFKVPLVLLVVSLIGFVHAINKIGKRESCGSCCGQDATPQPEVYEHKEVKTAKTKSEKKSSRPTKKKKK